MLGFLPVALGGFLLLGRSRQLALLWLLACNLFFYAWWRPELLLLLLVSIGVNFAVAGLLIRSRQGGIWLTIGICFNLCLLGWFKYAGMFLSLIHI